MTKMSLFHENEPEAGTHFRMTNFERRLVLILRQRDDYLEITYFSLPRLPL